MSQTDLSPQDVAEGVADGRYTLVDVREPAEYADVRIEGAANHPLSAFNPEGLPKSDNTMIVFYCGVGGRSAKALEAAMAAGVTAAHMDGGIKAWIAEGRPVV